MEKFTLLVFHNITSRGGGGVTGLKLKRRSIRNRRLIEDINHLIAKENGKGNLSHLNFIHTSFRFNS